MSEPARSPANPSFLGTFALVFVSAAGLFVIDTFLARMEQAESQAQAARLLAEGQRLAKEGRPLEGIERFRSALAAAPGNMEAQLALAQELLAAKKLTDAKALLTDMLVRDPTDGTVNLLMARALAKEGRTAEAITYYHTAIYGRWPKDPAANRVSARFELIDLLVKDGDKRELLAELLPQQDEAPTDVQTRMRIGRLFILSGSPARAAEIFRQILRQDPQDAEACAGLAEAQFAEKNFRGAQAEFSAAARLKPGDGQIQKRLDLTDEILALDPTKRGIRASERYSRSAKLVELALEELSRCAGPSPPEAIETLKSQASGALKSRVRAGRESEAADDDLELAEELWQARKKFCHEPAPASAEPLALVLDKLAQ